MPRVFTVDDVKGLVCYLTGGKERSATKDKCRATMKDANDSCIFRYEYDIFGYHFISVMRMYFVGVNLYVECCNPDVEQHFEFYDTNKLLRERDALAMLDADLRRTEVLELEKLNPYIDFRAYKDHDSASLVYTFKENNYEAQ